MDKISKPHIYHLAIVYRDNLFWWSVVIMKAIRIGRAPTGDDPFSAANPAPSSALEIAEVPMPVPMRPGEMLVQVKATTVIRDNLTWPEMYNNNKKNNKNNDDGAGAQLGNDFSGVVVAVVSQVSDDEERTGQVSSSSSPFKPGDEVYGMIHADRGGAWAEYAIVTTEEASLKPEGLSWEEAAALPLSALTADQALFDQAGLELLEAGAGAGAGAGKQRRVLITGAAGGVGTYLVQFGLAAGHAVVAATSSHARNDEFLWSLGVRETVEYAELLSLSSAAAASSFDVIIDTVGGETLRRCWALVKSGGALVSVDSGSWNFVEEHRTTGYSRGKEDVRARFFIVEPSKKSMARISDVVEAGRLKIFVSTVLPLLEKVKEGYDLCHSGQAGRGKIVMVL